MKIGCSQCGCHFRQEFEKTLKPPCNMWGDKGFTNLPVKYKKKLWDWVFKMPSDEISILFDTAIAWMVQGVPILERDKFVNLVPGWEKYDEMRQQDIERWWFIEQNRGNHAPDIKDYWKQTTKAPDDNENLELPN